MVLSRAAALDVGISRESTTSFRRSGHCRSRNSSRISKTLRADFVSSFDIYSRPPLCNATWRLERFQAKWKPVRVKKTRQMKNLEPRFDSIETEKALACRPRKAHNAASKNPSIRCHHA